MPAATTKDGWPSKIKFTKTVLESFEKKNCKGRQRTVWDEKETGLCVLVSPKEGGNVVTLRTIYYINGKAAYTKIGRIDDTVHYRDAKGELHELKCWDMEAVRDRARAIRSLAKQGIDPKRLPASNNFGEMLDLFIAEKKAKGKRTIVEIERLLRRYVEPEWGHRSIREISKSDINGLLTWISDGKIKGLKGRMIGTPQIADAVRAQISSFFSWYMEEHAPDSFVSPFVKVKRRGPEPQETARDRQLDDAEIRALWKACDELGIYGAGVKLALLTGQRFHKVTSMRHSQIGTAAVGGYLDALTGEWVEGYTVNDVWDARQDDDPDNKEVSEVPLSPLARSIIDELVEVDASALGHQDFVFSVNGRKPYTGWQLMKVDRLDPMMREILGREIRPWQHRDLRRTARSLMPRAGVSEYHAERALGHKLPTIHGTYDRHSYLREKAEAFLRLSKLVELIVNPPEKTNVVPFPQTQP